VRLLVTGASRGIGRAVARRLHARGDALALSARSDTHLAPVLAELPGTFGVPAELTRASELESLVSRAAAALGGLDGLVHCAGVVRYAPALDITSTDLDAQLRVNFVAGFTLTQAVARRLLAANGSGAIIHVASTLGLRPARGSAAYAASKAALIAATRAFALELAAHGIRVNAVAPGIVDTDMVRVVRDPDRDVLTPQQTAERLDQQMTALASLHPLGRLGTPDEIAEAVEYLLDAKFVTGTVLVVDGGLTLND
jgi:NAD(P)-dependent dehydrogenase (short-subunit alcohol dehydrogenase family)